MHKHFSSYKDEQVLSFLPSHVLCTCLRKMGFGKALLPLCFSKIPVCKRPFLQSRCISSHYHLNCRNVQIYMMIWSVMASCPDKVMLNEPLVCFSAHIWRPACDTGGDALHTVAGEQVLVPNIFYPPAGLIVLPEPVVMLPPTPDFR